MEEKNNIHRTTSNHFQQEHRCIFIQIYKNCLSRKLYQDIDSILLLLITVINDEILIINGAMIWGCYYMYM